MIFLIGIEMQKRKPKMLIGFVLVGGLLLAGVVWLGTRIAVGSSRLTILRQEAHFPEVSGFNLLREERVFPGDFQGEYNLLFIPFQQWQQREVNTWIPAAQGLESSRNDVFYYEFPTIYELPAISRTFINEGMRAGIPDQTSRERTITLYLDKSRFKKALDISSEETITIVLVDQEGTILWRDTGSFSQKKLDSLLVRLDQLD
jgi:hypothetical protein